MAILTPKSVFAAGRQVPKNEIIPLLDGIIARTASFSPISYAFDPSTADADPGAGKFRLNQAVPGSATAAYFDNENLSGTSVAEVLDSWDDSTSTVKGKLQLTCANDPSVFHAFAVSGSVVTGTGYRKLTLTHIGGSGTFEADDVVMAQFLPSGDAGAGALVFSDRAEAEAADFPGGEVAAQLLGDGGLRDRRTELRTIVGTPSVVKPWHVLFDNGQYAEMRFPDGNIDVSAFAGSDQGVDGSTDDTELFQYAGDYVNRAWWEASGGAAQGRSQRGRVFVPAGLWTIDPADPMIAFDYMKLVGAGDGQSMIQAYGTGAGALVQRPSDATYNSNQRTTNCEVSGIRFILTGASQTALDLAHCGRLRITENQFSRQDRVDDWNNDNQSVLASTRGVRLRSSDSVLVGGDIVEIDHNHFYFLARGIDSGGGAGAPGPEGLKIIHNEISDCDSPITVNDYGGAGGLIANNFLQRWLAGNRAVDLVGRYWTIRENYLESVTNTNGPILLRSGALRCIVYRNSHVNHTDHTAIVGPPLYKSLGNNDGTNCIDEYGDALASTFVGHPVP